MPHFMLLHLELFLEDNTYWHWCNFGNKTRGRIKQWSYWWVQIFHFQEILIKLKSPSELSILLFFFPPSSLVSLVQFWWIVVDFLLVGCWYGGCFIFLIFDCICFTFLFFFPNCVFKLFMSEDLVFGFKCFSSCASHMFVLLFDTLLLQ